MHRLTPILVLFFTLQTSFAQTIEGQVVDIDDYGISFVNIRFVKSDKKTGSDLDGKFTLQIEESDKSDTIVFTAMGYTSAKKTVKDLLKKNPVKIILQEEGIELIDSEVDFSYNPAIAIMDNAVKNRKINSPKSVKEINYHRYSRLEVDLNNLSEQTKKRPIIKKVIDEMEEMDLPQDTSGKEYIPMFVTETYSQIFERNNPSKYRENTLAIELHGVGVNDAQYWTQFTSSNFTELNFYRDLVTLIDKDFHSPLSSNWDGYYDVYLMDSMVIEGEKVYEIDLEPKRISDLAFKGKIWIYDSTFALHKVELSLLKTANINFIDNIGLRYVWMNTDSNRYWVKSSEIDFDVQEINKNDIGLKGNFYSENSKITYNSPSDPKYYSIEREVSETATEQAPEFWEGKRPETDTAAGEVDAIQMINDIKELPTVKSYIDIIRFFAYGHIETGKFDIGPVLYSYAWNEIEGHRVRLGGRTNINFSKKLQLSGYGAYGFMDKEWKYEIKALFMLSRKHWTTLSIRHRKELDILGISGFFESPFFNLLTKWGSQIGSFYYEGTDIRFFRQWSKSFSTDLKAVTYSMDPTFEFTHDPGTGSREKIQTTEVGANFHFGYQEKFIVNDFYRSDLRSKYPELDFSYIIGLSDVLGSSYNYHKLAGQISHRFPFGRLGKTDIRINGGVILNPLPYPLLNIAIGNQTLFYAEFAYNMMNYFEFVSDKHISLNYEHHFNGYILNRVPLLRRLKWRTVINCTILKGSVRQENIDLIPEEQQTFTTFGTEPYVDIGYGIENIFQVFRIQAFHRLTYRDNPNAQNFNVKMTFQFSF